MATIAFDDNQQAAVVGHALQDPTLWERLDQLKVDENWLTSRRLAELWPHIANYRKEYRRPPGSVELLAYAQLRDPTSGGAFDRTIQWCAKSATEMKFDALSVQITRWAEFQVMVTRAKEITRLSQAGDHEGAAKEWRAGSLDLDRLTSTAAGSDRLESAAERVQRERAIRLAQAPNVLQYGISYLDDALHGIIPNDLVVVGGRSGAGKTELGKIIAAANAAAGHNVDYFALEAEELEIERRLKFSILVRLAIAANPALATLGKDPISYPQWRMGRLEGLLGPFDAEANAEIIQKCKNLRTYYRAHGDFDVDTLERRILEVKDTSRLIVLDHLHYVDLDDEQDENRAMKKVVKRARDLVLSTGVPMILIAHLRKEASLHLVPTMEDFHGSSDIFKIATVGVVLAAANGASTADSRAAGYATFVRVVKARMDQQPLRYVGCGFYSKAQGVYLPDYGLGTLNLAQTKWTPAKDSPEWAKHGTISDLSEIS